MVELDNTIEEYEPTTHKCKFYGICNGNKSIECLELYEYMDENKFNCYEE